MESISDFRCACGKLLFKGTIIDGRVEIKCKSCRTIQVYTESAHFVKSTNSLTVSGNTSVTLR